MSVGLIRSGRVDAAGSSRRAQAQRPVSAAGMRGRRTPYKGDFKLHWLTWGPAIFMATLALCGRISAATPGPVAPMEMGRESTGVLSESEFFARLTALIEAKEWNEAREMILAARSVRPPLEWLARRDGELRLVQCRLGHELDSTTEMLAAARLYLNGDNDRSRKMLELARLIYGADPRRAIELAKEIRRKSPDYPPVRRLLAEWQPRSKS